MGLKSQLSSLPRHLTALIHHFMSSPPTEVDGLFFSQRLPLNEIVQKWRDNLSDDANLCKLRDIEICKATSDKLHEFLLLRFAHPTHPTAHAMVIVDRTVKEAQALTLVSPSASSTPIPANDMVAVLPPQDSVETYLTQRFGRYERLCFFRYDTTCPSAAQIANLLVAVSLYRPNYNLYEHNCYWFADVIFEGCKRLFPEGLEHCVNHKKRRQYIVELPTIETDIIPYICEAYQAEWKEFMRRPKKGEELQAWKREVEDQRCARKQAERALEQAERAREEGEQAWKREAEDQRCAREQAERALEQAERAREEGEQAWKREAEDQRRAREAAERLCKALLAREGTNLDTVESRYKALLAEEQVHG